MSLTAAEFDREARRAAQIISAMVEELDRDRPDVSPAPASLPPRVPLSMRNPRAEPPLGDVANYWRSTPEAVEVIPGLTPTDKRWNRPFCFACGWHPPVKPGRAAWMVPVTSGWLDRAHLLDHAFGGSSAPCNLVPLCLLCHDVMPQQPSREAAMKWVRDRDCDLPDPVAWQAFTDTSGSDPGSARSRQARMFRLRGNYLLQHINRLAAAPKPDPKEQP